MAKSVRFKNNVFLDATSVEVKSSSGNRRTLDNVLSGFLYTKYFQTLPNSSSVLTTSVVTRALVVFLGTSNAVSGIYVVSSVSNGNAYVCPLVAATDVTTSTSSNTVTFTNNASASLHALVFGVLGNITVT